MATSSKSTPRARASSARGTAATSTRKTPARTTAQKTVKYPVVSEEQGPGVITRAWEPGFGSRRRRMTAGDDSGAV